MAGLLLKNTDMKYADIFTLNLSGKTIVIIGVPASGKTTLGRILASLTGQQLVSTDDYMPHGYKESLYAMMDDLRQITAPVIVEGIQGYRLLRKGVETGEFFPDVVIELKVTPEQVERVYRRERQADKLPKLPAFVKMHDTILSSYKAMENDRPPEWIEVQNEY